MSIQLTETPVLETERLILRAPQADDWDICAPFLISERSKYMGGPYTRHTAWRSMGHIIGHWVLRDFGMFVFCDRASGAALGIAGPYFPEGWAEPEIGWSIWSADAEGKGIAYEAAAAARAYAFNTLGWATAVSYIDPENRRSIALAKRLGATRDPDASLPNLPGWDGTFVFRHTAPEAL